MFLVLVLLIPLLTDTDAISPSAGDVGFYRDLEGEDVLVKIQDGKLRGRRRPSISEAPGSDIYSHVDWYLGIPYAEPPIGPLRFKDPRPPKKWSGIKNAVQFSKICPQHWQYTQYGELEDQDEDCLYLNIYSPVSTTLDNSELLAVMVYIHGGSYVVGTGAVFIGDVLSQQGVVVVTLNYRLGLLGFLTSGTDHMTGNYGLLDQILALKWIKNNIHKFRGDPNRVTIFGNSAGGSSVGLLSASPLTEGLFQQTIAQSGSALSYWACHNNSVDFEKFFRQLAKNTGCYKNYVINNNSKQPSQSSTRNYSILGGFDGAELDNLTQCMRSVDWTIFTSYEFEEKIPPISPDRISNFMPVIDGKVLPKPPRELYSSSFTSYSDSIFDRCSKEGSGGSSFHIKALMTGTIENEMSRHMGAVFLRNGFYSVDDTLDYNYDDGFDRRTFEKAIDHVMSRSFGYDELISHIVLSQYTNWSNCSDPYVNRYKYIEFLTDLDMLAPTVELAGFSSDAGIPTFLYLLNFQDKNSDSAMEFNHHEMELSYVFGGPFTGRVVEIAELGGFNGYTYQNKKTSRALMKMWSNFAKYGNPMGKKSERIPGLKNTSWKTYHRNHPYYMRIDPDSASLETDLKPHHVNMWNRVIPAAISRINKLKSSGKKE